MNIFVLFFFFVFFIYFTIFIYLSLKRIRKRKDEKSVKLIYGSRSVSLSTVLFGLCILYNNNNNNNINSVSYYNTCKLPSLFMQTVYKQNICFSLRINWQWIFINMYVYIMCMTSYFTTESHSKLHSIKYMNIIERD